MSGFASVARAALGALPVGTLNQQTLSFAFMEFLSDRDSNSMKSLWLKHGFSDVSPMWGNQSNVPTFATNPGIISQWPQFQQEMQFTEADWYYLSGHHGRMYASDFDGSQSEIEHVNTQEFIGFFNHVYHDGPWEQASVTNAAKGVSDRDVYMTTSRDNEFYDDLTSIDNPLYSNVHNACKGLMLVGCNTLIYKHDRIMLNTYFPNALIIGLLSTENNSIRKILRVSQSYGRKLFTNSESIDPEKLVRDLNPQMGIIDRIAVMKSGTLYYTMPDNSVMKVPATDNLTRTR